MIRLIRTMLLLVVMTAAAGCARRADTPSDTAAGKPAASSTAANSPVSALEGTAIPVNHVTDGSSIETSHAAAPGTAPGKSMSLREAYPGYKPGANDPEADAAIRGYRTVPVSNRTFETGGAASLDDLVQMVATGIDLGDGAALDRSAVTYEDFETILWPEFPQSRPAAGVPIKESWDFLRRRHMASFNRTTGEYHGKGLRVVSIKVGKVVYYTNFKLHDDLEVTLVDGGGNAIQFDMVRTVVECHGRFKLYSTRD